MELEEFMNGETLTLEFKKDLPKEKEQYLKTAVAFANGNGGKIVFGVRNNTWEVIGFSQEEIFGIKDGITSSIYDGCEPKILPEAEITTIDGKPIIIVTIHAGMQKPYYLKSKGMMNGTYVRVCGTTRQAEDFTINELHFTSTNRHFDQLPAAEPVSEERIQALCNRLNEHATELFLEKKIKSQPCTLTETHLLSWKVLMKQEGRIYPTNAFLLLEGNNNEFPDSMIRCACFKGTERAYVLDRLDITGPVDQQVDEALTFVKRHINQGIRIQGLIREDVLELPEESLREMISNAVCHRSYLVPGKIQVAVFDDRVEVTSPGRMSPELTVEELKNGHSVIRNEAIAAVFSWMHLIEGFGLGIPKIFKDCERYGLPEPTMGDFGISFRISMYRRDFEFDEFGVMEPTFRYNAGKKPVNDTPAAILNVLRKHPEYSQADIARATGIDVNNVKYHVRMLKEKGKIRRQGTSHKGIWIVL